VTTPIAHALVLNLHQPAGNLDELLAREPWQVREILCAIDRIPRRLWGREEVGRVHVSLSGTLLETLSDPAFQARVYGIVKLGDLLWHLQNRAVIEILGTGYYHPVLPLIDTEDADAHIGRWLGLGHHLFGRHAFQGFWPPEMGFSMELIPILRRHGYRYVLADVENLAPVTPMRWEELRYRPHIARFGGEEIVVIPRDRDLSNAQESGMTPDWFLREVAARTKHAHFAPLVTTCTDGDNGGWFRNLTDGANFWDAFYVPLLERVRAGESGGLRPMFIHDYLDIYGPWGEVIVRTGAWNTGEHSGVGFVQWTGSAAQRDAWARLRDTSARIRAVRRAAPAGPEGDAARRAVEDAYWRLLRAQTSCHFFWGDAWLPRAHAAMDDALARLPPA
jgi:4-alpha-glucanotransferase